MYAWKRIVHGLLVAATVLSMLGSAWPAPIVGAASSVDQPPAVPSGVLRVLYRTRVHLRNAHDRARLEQLDVVVLSEEKGSALVLADDAQLEALARLRFEPTTSDDLVTLLNAAGPDKAWLRSGLRPLLDRAATLQEREAALQGAERGDADALTAAREALRKAMRALTPEQKAGLAALSSVDDDGDGLTNTQEQWWCTDLMNPDSDGDGTSDGDEVQALKDWMANRTAGPPATGKPFAQWPPQIQDCVDDDQDSVPDMAERWDLGLNMNRESTDRDKFDDGQELFGNTYCPGSGGFCGYGALPRNEGWGVIFAEMPSWVKAPGNHPLVAAFPVPEVDVVESSFHVQTVTTVTTDHTITQGTERSYSTSKTEGTSSSVSDTETWNQWEEISRGHIQPVQMRFSRIQRATFSVNWRQLRTGTLVLMKGALKSTLGGIVSCGTEAVAAYVGASSERGLCKQGVSLGLSDIQVGWNIIKDSWNKDKSQAEQNEQKCNLSCKDKVQGAHYGDTSSVEDQTKTIGQQDYARPISGQDYVVDDSGTLKGKRRYDISFPLLHLPALQTTTTTRGSSHGGAHTTTHTEYEEHTITNGEAFSSSESWGNATAQDSAHAADLWFTYKVRNTGTEYAREIANLTFNIYIGDDPNPAYTYHVANDLGGDGKFHNFMPDEEHTYTSARIPLTLDQMKAIDLGGPIRIVVEDFTYGIDELFYQDAVNAGVLIAIEDGTDDGDEAIDTYLIPTWGNETVLDVLARYFPHETDAAGNLIAIWTPEYHRSDTPSWCVEPRHVGTTLWCKHALSTADWWNIYTSGLGDGTQGFQDTPAAGGSVALFRFNKDTDLDGYSDRSERRLGTDPNDPSSFPKPELIAGIHTACTGEAVPRPCTATLSLLNTGLYDAYGVEAVMIAPDDSINITNNTVGGSGRVRAQKQVIVGSRIKLQNPLPAAWTQPGHAVPAAAEYYTGQQDRTYTFTVQCSNPGGCDVGDGAWTLAWDDGAGNSGTLNFGAGYASPTFLDVGTLGVKLALYSGRVYDGESFTVSALTPRDTFQYTINREPYTEPVVIVSYNDPQGNHKFVTPVRLSSPTEDLVPHSGKMIHDGAGVEIVTEAPFTAGQPMTTTLVVQAPTHMVDAHLFLEFIDPQGTVVREEATTVTLEPGPNVVSIPWNSNDFNPTYNPNQDYIVMAFFTDWQGNILDTAARPLSSFQADPKPALALDATATTWDFGTAAQGTLLKRTFAFANTGAMDLKTHLSAPVGVRVSRVGIHTLSPSDVVTYEVTIDTTDLPTGPYSTTLTLRTSDPATPVRTILIRGTIAPAPPEPPGGAVIRPLDWTAVITGTHTQGEWVEFTYTLEPDPQTLHPVRVYSEDYRRLWGLGKIIAPPDTAYRVISATVLKVDAGCHGDFGIYAPINRVIFSDYHRYVGQTKTIRYPSTGQDEIYYIYGGSCYGGPHLSTGEHARVIQEGPNVWRIEWDDTLGDRDYNDLVVRIRRSEEIEIHYIVEQVNYNTARLNLPESFTDRRAYQVQFGRRYVFSAAGQATQSIRVPKQLYTATSLELLVSDTGVSSGDLILSLDIGADGTAEWTHNAATAFPATFTITDVVAALNAYLVNRTDVPWGADVDVPVRVDINRAGQVLLTNVQLTPASARTRFVRLPAQSYSNVTLTLHFNPTGISQGPLAFTVDVGADGSVDWSFANPVTFPATLNSPNLATAFNAYLSGRSGEVDVPIRIVPSPAMAPRIYDVHAVPVGQSDVQPASVQFGSIPTEGEIITPTVTLRNNGNLDSGPLAVSFFATPPSGSEWYVGSALVPNVPAGGTAQAGVPWNTLGFTGTVPVRVVVDPFDRLAETDETNNVVTATLTIRTRPDLLISHLQLSNPEPVVGEPVTVTLTLRNRGQTTAGAQTVALYVGNPDSGGTVVEAHALASLPGGNTHTVTFTWTPSAPGQYRLFARADRDNAVDEFDEGNNDTWRDVYVGLRGPIEIDSGGTSDVPYDANRGYGYLTTESNPVTLCGNSPEQTLRSAPNGHMEYRFDHLQPGHFYHLDVVLYECDGLSRQERILVDGFEVAPTTNLGDAEPHRFSIRLDPALYIDRSIVVAIEEVQGNDAIVATVALHDIDYRYADAGGSHDVAYTPERGYGYLDGVKQDKWGSLPYQTRRIDLPDDDPSDDPDNEVRYRFDGLRRNKQYKLLLTFYHETTPDPVLQVRVDGIPITDQFAVPTDQRVDREIPIPPSTYASDGQIVVGIARTNALVGGFVNEIALEKETLARPTEGCNVRATPYVSYVYGRVTVAGNPAPVGTLIEALNPRGDVVGCFVVHTAGYYGFMPIYGEDAGATPPIPGMRDGETVRFRVAGQVAQPSANFVWHDDKAIHLLDLSVGAAEQQSIPLHNGWNLISFRLMPQSTAVQDVLTSVSGQYDMVLGENGTFIPSLPDTFNTLHDMYPGQAYWLRLIAATATLQVSGSCVDPTTPITLTTGWNWVGYLPEVSNPLTVALQSIAGQYEMVIGEVGTYVTGLPDRFQTLTEMRPGAGYLIRMTAPATLRYPSGGTPRKSELSSLQVKEGACTEVNNTPYFTHIYGTITVQGAPAPVGTVIEAWTPRDEVAGCFEVHSEGAYGLMRLYGADNDTGQGGFVEGDAIRLVVNRCWMVTLPWTWRDDRGVHRVDMEVSGECTWSNSVGSLGRQGYLPLLWR